MHNNIIQQQKHSQFELFLKAYFLSVLSLHNPTFLWPQEELGSSSIILSVLLIQYDSLLYFISIVNKANLVHNVS